MMSDLCSHLRLLNYVKRVARGDARSYSMACTPVLFIAQVSGYIKSER